MNALPQDNGAPSGATAALIAADCLGLFIGVIVSLVLRLPWFYAVPLTIGLGFLVAAAVPIRLFWQSRH